MEKPCRTVGQALVGQRKDRVCTYGVRAVGRPVPEGEGEGGLCQSVFHSCDKAPEKINFK